VHCVVLPWQKALTEHDRLRNGRQAVAQARAGLAVARGAATPALAAELHAMEARGLALVGDTREAHRAMLEAQRCYELLRPDGESPWQALYTEAAFAADLGKILGVLGEADQAIKLSTAAVRDYEPWRVRARCFAQTDLAYAHLLGRDFEQAAAVGRDALRTAAQVSSTRTLDRLYTLQRKIQPLRAASSHLRELDERIADFLTRV
jgi:tetratricopeptide (TPR) repeat protein